MSAVPIYVCVRAARADANGGPVGSARRPDWCGDCGEQVYTDPDSMRLTILMGGDGRPHCTDCVGLEATA